MNSKTPPEHLLIFTRYPEPGNTKTRLIPALGAVGAAELQRHMTEHTVNWVRQYRQAAPLSVEIRFASGSLAQMQTWLGLDLDYTRQGEGDLGDRLTQAFQTAFEQGQQRVVAIGTDCPDLGMSQLSAAFSHLHQADLVLGPATDGGYYLIGLQRWLPEVFQGIDWGSEQVLQQTLAIAQSLQLAVALLQPLTDIDRPENLPLWHTMRGTQ